MKERIETPSFYVYLLHCGDGSYYTGYTTDLERRLKEHQSGQGSKYTASHLPVRLAAAWPFPSRSQAMSVEARIKRRRREEKEAFLKIQEPEDLLQALDKKKEPNGRSK